MRVVKALPVRTDVKTEETWDLTHLFKHDQDYHQAIEAIQQAVDQFEAQYKGTIQDAASAIKALEQYEKVMQAFVPISTYANLALNEDQTNNVAQMRASQLSSIQANANSKLSFVSSELLALSEETLKEAIEQDDRYKRFLQQQLEKKPYQLHPEVEKTLAAYSATFGGPYSLYNTTKLVDMNFDDFEVNGEMYPLSYVSFEGDWESDPDHEKRHAAYKAFYGTLQKYEHTTAKTYDLQVQTEKTTANTRGYDSVFDYLLQSQEVDASMYHRQIDLIMEELAPHMRKYAQLLQKVYGLEKMTFADLKIPLDPTYEPKVSIADAKQYMNDGLQIMGDHYLSMVNRSFDERWIDFAQNKGKSTGAFCSSPHGYHPYILISWTGSMEDVFVLAHELGHAGHFYHANAEQNIFNARTSMYFIEAPSTMNEMLMANHLLNNSKDLRFKRWVISSIVARTYYHNFVTHLLEAAYQRDVYRHVDQGGNVNATMLNDLKRRTLEQFWGDTVDINDDAARTWMRQPHYYMGLYPYTYSAGLTISTQVSKRILTEGQAAVDDWINVLETGGTKSPAELSKMAGIDITTEQPLRDTIAYIGELIDELVKLTEQIDAEKQA